MSRICELTGKGRQVGNNVSHANNKTKRTFLPNLQNVTLISDALNRSIRLRVSTHGLRSVEHVGGLDNWLLKASDDDLSLRARRLKREVRKANAGTAAAVDLTARQSRARWCAEGRTQELGNEGIALAFGLRRTSAGAASGGRQIDGGGCAGSFMRFIFFMIFM